MIVARSSACRRGLVALTCLGMAAGLVGCGGGADTDAKPRATTTTARSPRTTAPAKPGAARLAEKATLTVGDLGVPWREHTKAGEAGPPDKASCLATLGSVAAVAENGVAHGAILQRGDAVQFVRSTSIVFVDEAAALGYLDTARSSAYHQCRADELKPDPNAEASFRVTDVSDAAGNGADGFEISIDLVLEEVIDGTLEDTSATVQMAIFRVGRSVVEQLIESNPMPDDPANIGDLGYEEIRLAMQVALDRLRRG